MSIDIIRGTSRSKVATEQLDKILTAAEELDGQLFIGYPVIGTPAGPHLVDALLISERFGVIVFDLIEGLDTTGYQNRQDDSVNKVESRLKQHSELMNRRILRIPINSISFAPAVNQLPSSDAEYPIANEHSIINAIKSCTWKDRGELVYEKTLSVVESISTIRHNRVRRNLLHEDSLGAKLKKLEDSIATLDRTQGKAVIETVDGIQRIRGLAGSGKTIVLALKAAYFHAQNPDWRIAVTFYSRSLKDHFRRLITAFCLEATNQEPDWDNLRVLHSWGARGGSEDDGIYREYCRENGVPFMNFNSARERFGSVRAFAGACQDAVTQAQQSNPIYDAILIDEAQDVSPEFLRLCHASLRHPKRLVYAYDELQSLSGESLPPPDEIFADVESTGWGPTPGAERGPRRDIILEKCYRNSRPVLVTAHALGFGIYRKPPTENETGLIQMFDNAQLWTDVGYRVKNGVLADGTPVSLHRTEDTSPAFLEDHSDISELIEFHGFDDKQDQAAWLAAAIKRNIENDELRHDDIMVINPDPRTTRTEVGLARRFLLEAGIDTHIAGFDTDPDTFFRLDRSSITFTGIYRAKGNEAGMVYIINAQECQASARNLSTLRNRLFTAITRSKSWVRVLGVGPEMDRLIEEYDQLREAGFALDFVYPDAETRKTLRIVHRDVSLADQDRIEARQRGLFDLVEDLQGGVVHLQDMDPAVLEQLKSFMDS